MKNNTNSDAPNAANPAWILQPDHLELEELATIDWRQVVRAVEQSTYGALTAKLVPGTEQLTIHFNESRAKLQHDGTEMGPFRTPVFPYRAPPFGANEVFLCEGCGIDLEVPYGETLPRKDAFCLFKEYLKTGELPTMLPAIELSFKQLILPGLEECVLSDLEWRTVEWRDI